MEKANNVNYGSFICSIPIHDMELESQDPRKDGVGISSNSLVIKEHKKVLVKPISQRELADGWLQVIKHPDYKIKEINGVSKKYWLYNTFTINLAQLPDNLWDKLVPVYNDSTLEYYKANYRRYRYIVEATPHDNNIRRLRDCLQNPYNHLDEIRELVNYLEENDIYGWVKIRGTDILEKN
jgi:hypothetical protein